MSSSSAQLMDAAEAEIESFVQQRAPNAGYMADFYAQRAWTDTEILSMKAAAEANSDTVAADLCDKLLTCHVRQRRALWAMTKKHFGA